MIQCLHQHTFCSSAEVLMCDWRHHCPAACISLLLIFVAALQSPHTGGRDFLGAVEFVNLVRSNLNIQLLSALLPEYPTAAAVTEYLHRDWQQSISNIMKQQLPDKHSQLLRHYRVLLHLLHLLFMWQCIISSRCLHTYEALCSGH